jgi:NADP-reducing hydrogenase subunit HndB
MNITMKSIAELTAIKDKMMQNATVRAESGIATRIVVAVGECGFAAGAREIVVEIIAELSKKEIHHVTVAQTDCTGMCSFEPVMDVIIPEKAKVTYVHLTPEKIAKIISSHIIDGVPVQEYTIDAYDIPLQRKD